MLTKEEMLNNFAHNIEEERKSLDFTIEVDPNSFEDMEQWVRFGVVIAVLRR